MVELDVETLLNVVFFSTALAKNFSEFMNLVKFMIIFVSVAVKALLPSDKTGRYLPVSFYKRHSRRTTIRLAGILQANPAAGSGIRKQKNETLYERFDNNAVMLRSDKKLSLYPLIKKDS